MKSERRRYCRRPLAFVPASAKSAALARSLFVAESLICICQGGAERGPSPGASRPAKAADAGLAAAPLVISGGSGDCGGGVRRV
ncbi:unnamed protein product [Lampetra planeri]